MLQQTEVFSIFSTDFFFLVIIIVESSVDLLATTADLLVFRNQMQSKTLTIRKPCLRPCEWLLPLEGLASFRH